MPTDKKLEQLAHELERLQRDHRALAMEHTALLYLCTAMLPLIEADAISIERLLDASYAAAKNRADDVLLDAREDWPLFDATWDRLAGILLRAARHRSTAPSPESPRQPNPKSRG